MRRDHSCSIILFLFFASWWLTSCKPGVPSEYIQMRQMEDILYDYHLSQAMLINDQQHNTPEMQQLYKLTVLQKHGVSEQQFEESMAYYMRHADRLHEIYENMATRYERAALEHGLTVSELNQYGSAIAKGDTADVWSGERSMMLTSREPFHQRSFTLKADSTYLPGDRLMLNFDAKYIVQEGARDGIVVMAVRFANDSVASQTQRVSSNSHYTLQIEDAQRLGLKTVSGYFMLNKPLSEQSSTLKLLSLTNIQLVRMHTKNIAPHEDADSVETKPQEAIRQTIPTQMVRRSVK